VYFITRGVIADEIYPTICDISFLSGEAGRGRGKPPCVAGSQFSSVQVVPNCHSTHTFYMLAINV